MSTTGRRWPAIGAAPLAATLWVAGVTAAAPAAGPPVKITLTPASVAAGSSGNEFTYRVSAVKALTGHVNLTVPAGWTAPQVSQKSGPGYVTSARGTCASAGQPAVAGSGPWTIRLAIRCGAGQHLVVRYGAGTSSTRVTAPGQALAYRFPASLQAGGHTYVLAAPKVTVDPGPAARLTLTGLADPSETGAPEPVTVTAVDGFGNVATGYAGTVSFVSSDRAAALPAGYTFTAHDAGRHTFAGGVMFTIAGSESVTVSDGANPSLAGSESVPVDGVYFVSATGSDSNPGTQPRPLRTIGAAVAKAAVASPPFAVDVAGGTYDEGGGVTVTSGTTIDGGFDPANWTQPAGDVTVITGAPQAVLADGATGVLLEHLTLQGNAPSGAGQSAYGLRAINTSSLTLHDVTATAGSGTAGAPGSSGQPGTAGEPGAAGGTGQSSGICTGSGPGGAGGSNNLAGGNGGNGGCFGNGADGSPGAWLSSRQRGGSGGSGGSGSSGTAGGAGGAGTPGPPGSDGPGGSAAGAGTATWVGEPGFQGHDGLPGSGGGGGGGGGEFFGCPPACEPAGGGGGGGGGAGGTAGGFGAGGSYGGGSFGIYLADSAVTLEGCVVRAGNGGAGGSGGNGGSGGAGGAAGAGGAGGSGGTAGSGGAGGAGGAGGTGGAGGSGGGGAGGPSIGILTLNSTATTDTTDTITPGVPGAGGAGGSNGVTTAPSGQQGQSGAITGLAMIEARKTAAARGRSSQQ